jgi:hypothetical protein
VFRNLTLAVMVLCLSSFLTAQQSMSNDSVIKLVRAGLSDDLIISTINASPGAYDTSADGLIALKKAGASDKVVASIVTKATVPASAGASPTTPVPVTIASTPANEAGAPTQARDKPRVYLTSASKGNLWNASRDQSMEMGKDFEKDCPSIRVTINQNAADYTVLLNHIEVGFSRDNQFQIANKNGDLISKTKEGGSINGGVKKACAIILADWAKP